MGNLAARMVGPAERDDVVQEALTRAWRKRSQFDVDRGSARSWLLAIVADRSRRTWRRPRRGQIVSGAGFVAGPDEVRLDLERAVANLPPRMRLAVDCVYFVDLTIGDTAVVMGVSEGTVKSTLSDARARLRTMLEVSSADS
jgi:DNA-directed RNA polymerase specialized sigma24 family protein